MRDKGFLRREILNLRNCLSLADVDEKSRIIGEIFFESIWTEREFFALQ